MTTAIREMKALKARINAALDAAPPRTWDLDEATFVLGALEELVARRGRVLDNVVYLDEVQR